MPGTDLQNQYDEFLFRITTHLLMPVNQILENCQKLRQETDENKDINHIQQQGFELLNLINDIRDYAESQTGRIVLNNNPTDLNGLVRRALEIGEWLVKEKPAVELKEGQIDDLPEAVVQSERILQILLNLIHNAVKFTDSGFISVSATYDGRSVAFHVEDTGVGILAEKQHLVFAPFETAFLDERDSRVGLGLGLPICKYLADQYQGEITFVSEIGRGTKFLFSLPVVQELKVD